jgi:hypothetical protein
MKDLPDKPSGLLRRALEDLERCRQDPRYEIDMGVWHLSFAPGVCTVCLAGAVMAQTLEIPPDNKVVPYDLVLQYGREWEVVVMKLRALNQFRIGYVGDGFQLMGLKLPEGIKPERIISEFDEDPQGFIHDLNLLADDLEEHGL